MPTDSGEVTKLLEAANAGDDQATRQLWTAAQAEIRQMAAGLLKHETPTANLQPTIVVNEVSLRMNAVGGDQPAWEHRAHFFGCVWRVMRQFLIDYARERGSQKRGAGYTRVPLDLAAGSLTDLDQVGEHAEDLLSALDRFRESSPRQHEVLWRRLALDQTVDDVAVALGISPRTVAEDWRYARAWLRRELDREEESP